MVVKRHYALTLSHDERAEFEYIAGRYHTCGVAYILLSYMPEGLLWSSPGDITFRLDDIATSAIAQYGRAEDMCWPGFSGGLAHKLWNVVHAA